MMASETRGSRRTLRSFWRPLAELNSTCSPSKSTHTGVTCGRPSGIRVPRLAKARLVNKSRYFSGITADIKTLQNLNSSNYSRLQNSLAEEWHGMMTQRGENRYFLRRPLMPAALGVLLGMLLALALAAAAAGQTADKYPPTIVFMT